MSNIWTKQHKKKWWAVTVSLYKFDENRNIFVDTIFKVASSVSCIFLVCLFSSSENCVSTKMGHLVAIWQFAERNRFRLLDKVTTTG